MKAGQSAGVIFVYLRGAAWKRQFKGNDSRIKDMSVEKNDNLTDNTSIKNVKNDG